MSITVDDTTKASLPGRIIISASRFLAYYNIKGFKKLYYLILFRLPLQQLHCSYKNDEVVMEWISKSEHFEMGCTNPSVIINRDKGLIATFTNLTSYGNEATPVIKISKEKIHLIASKNITNNQRIATVSLYAKNDEDPEADAWADFHPLIPNCFSNDTNACNMLTESLNESAWKCLALGLEQIKNKEAVGLYYVAIDNDLVYASY